MISALMLLEMIPMSSRSSSISGHRALHIRRHFYPPIWTRPGSSDAAPDVGLTSASCAVAADEGVLRLQYAYRTWSLAWRQVLGLLLHSSGRGSRDGSQGFVWNWSPECHSASQAREAACAWFRLATWLVLWRTMGTVPNWRGFLSAISRQLKTEKKKDLTRRTQSGLLGILIR